MLQIMLMVSVGEAWRRSHFFKLQSDLFLEVESIRGQLASFEFMGRFGLLPNRWLLSA
jgi:hypothetical protein